jgi:hypothetical protein
MTDDARAFKGAALQALTSLGHVEGLIQQEMARLSGVLDQADDAPDVMLADPDSPVNVLSTLTATRAELAAARAALEPFARAYSRKMDALGEIDVPVFVDPQRPDRNRKIKLGALREAARVFGSLSLGVETVDRLRHLETLVRDMTQELHSSLIGPAPTGLHDPNESQRIRNLLDRARKLL